MPDVLERPTVPAVQGQADARRVALQRVGVRRVDLPVAIRQRDGGVLPVVARLSLSADLAGHAKGTHMSRFIEALEDWRGEALSPDVLARLLADVRVRLGATSAHLDARFPYFLTKHAPVTGRAGTMGYACTIAAVLDGGGYTHVLGAEVAVTTLCPCSKAIADAGAHNQRAWVRLRVRPRPGADLWFEDLIRHVETLGSCELYPVLKRADEKAVTERAYANPRFVEDVLRDVVLWLRADPRVAWFEAECEADESIHAHNAFAQQTETVPGGAEPAAVAGRHRAAPDLRGFAGGASGRDHGDWPLPIAPRPRAAVAGH
jgi:GTP cyclohydrolase I